MSGLAIWMFPVLPCLGTSCSDSMNDCIRFFAARDIVLVAFVFNAFLTNLFLLIPIYLYTGLSETP